MIDIDADKKFTVTKLDLSFNVHYKMINNELVAT